MKLTLHQTAIPDVILREHGVFEDERGFFARNFDKKEFAAQGIEYDIVNINRSFNKDN